MKTSVQKFGGVFLLLLAANAHSATVYVDSNSANPTPPYGDWATAAGTIQDAVDAANPGDTVLVNDGVYATGGRTIGTNVVVNRVAVDKSVTVQSVNGPVVTVIQGGGSIGTNPVRCVYLTHSAALIGFTLTMGRTSTNRNLISGDSAGGGVWCASPSAVLSNCVVSANAAYGSGGGGYGGTWNNCTVSSNSSSGGGGVSSAILNNCTLIGNSTTHGGGGTSQSRLNNCLLVGNSAYDGGGNWAGALTNCTLTGNWATNGGAGGAGVLVGCTISNNWAETGGAMYFGTLINCLISSNSGNWGGGTYESTLTNCTLAGNVATRSIIYNNGGFGGGAYRGTLNNCTLVGNVAINVQNYSRGGGASWSVLNSCIVKSNSADIGGGVHSATLTNCTLSYNTALSGGGAAEGTLTDCLVSTNSARNGGGTALATLNRCMVRGNSASEDGGGANGGVLNSSRIEHNFGSYGGGTHRATLNNCVLYANSAGTGGGACYGSLNSCTVVSNSAMNSAGGFYARYSTDTLTNCIVYHNIAPWGAEYNFYPILDHSCTTPLYPGDNSGNFTNAPLFVDLAGGDLRLQSNSPCINAGSKAYLAGPADLDGNPRIVSGTIDLGAYEFQSPTSLISYQWLQRYELLTDGSADFRDLDADGMNNCQEWRARTNPTNALSVLKMLPPSTSPMGITAQWQSVSGVNYFLQRATNLSVEPAFASVRSNIIGQSGATIYADTNAIGAGPFFYRVGVQ